MNAFAQCSNVTVDTSSLSVMADTMALSSASDSIAEAESKFNWKAYIIPASLFAVGLYGNHNGWIVHQSVDLRNELQENIDHRFTIDDYMQYTPLVSVYALDAFGVNHRSTIGKQLVVSGMSMGIMAGLVNGLKYTMKKRRPDGSSRNSFPSGHTAMAFVGAELLYQEYKDVSPWIGIAGYTVAASTGFFRMYNNRHWLSDVLAGAGIGILSVRLSYWLYPKLFHPKHKRAVSWAVSPAAFDNNGIGFQASIIF